MSVDPLVQQLAEIFVDDVLVEVNATVRPVLKSERDAWVTRAAEAMQQSIEDECEDIRQALGHLPRRPVAPWGIEQ